MSAADEEIQELMNKDGELTDSEAQRLFLLLLSHRSEEDDDVKDSSAGKTFGTVLGFVFSAVIAFVALAALVRLGVWIWP